MGDKKTLRDEYEAYKQDDLSKPKLPPKNWAKDDLTEFLELAHRNAQATFVQRPDVISLYRTINDTFRKLTANLKNNPHIISSFLIHRAYSAWLTSVRLGMSTQLTEAHLTIRAVVEYSVYGLYLKDHPDKGDVWLSSGDSNSAKKRARNQLRMNQMLTHLDNVDSDLGVRIRSLYG